MAKGLDAGEFGHHQALHRNGSGGLELDDIDRMPAQKIDEAVQPEHRDFARRVPCLVHGIPPGRHDHASVRSFAAGLVLVEGRSEYEYLPPRRPQFAQHDARREGDAVHLIQVFADAGHHRFDRGRGFGGSVPVPQGKESRKVPDEFQDIEEDEADDARERHGAMGPVPSVPGADRFRMAFRLHSR